jgi:hypothetical protein
MGVVIEICVKHPGGPTRITVTDVYNNVLVLYRICSRREIVPSELVKVMVGKERYR